MERRRFIQRITVALASLGWMGGCTSGKKSNKKQNSAFEKALSENRLMPADLVMRQLDQRVNRYMQLSHHCAQSSFMALNEQFSLQGNQVLKALTPLPGIAERGETCGAVTGPLMAMGLIYGRGEYALEDWDAYQASLVPAGKFCTQFENTYGSTTCHGVQQSEFGRCYHLNNPEELQEFRAAGATGHCSSVVRKAVRMAAQIILKDPDIAPA